MSLNPSQTQQLLHVEQIWGVRQGFFKRHHYTHVQIQRLQKELRLEAGMLLSESSNQKHPGPSQGLVTNGWHNII